ncbi:MAG: carbohydrate ABC transporter permease [Bacillota bacterium]|jgi:sn-glycerol 3-phosphate transport system permease protein|nr:carbohydrate ABC transporter permease [Bacillota bacterium]
MMHRSLLRKVLTHALIIALCVVILLPLYVAITTSLKQPSDVFARPHKWIPNPIHWQNYKNAFSYVPLGRFLLNSVVQSMMVTTMVMFSSALAAYAFSYIEFPGKRPLFLLILATLMVSGEVTIIPNFLTIQKLGWVDTYWGLTVPFFAGAFGIFLLRQFFLQLPRELYDAAVVDGCGRFRYLFEVIIPLSRSALGTLGVYTYLSTWNQYFWPLIVTNSTQMRTVQIGISMLRDAEGDAWHIIMAGVVSVTLPAIILFLIFQKQLVRGIVGGAVKG